MPTPTNNKGQKVQTNALAVYAWLPFARITMDLLEEVAPMITNKSEAKFVLLGLKYDKNIPNNESLYASLLKEQNIYLAHYADF
eukprot:1493814-Ditylum_brightwellii.AAC.1